MRGVAGLRNYTLYIARTILPWLTIDNTPVLLTSCYKKRESFKLKLLTSSTNQHSLQQRCWCVLYIPTRSTVHSIEINTVLFNLFAESAECIAVVLFVFVCLIRYDGNTKGKKNHFLRKKLNILWDVTDMWTHTSLVKQPGLSVWTLNTIVKSHHVNDENANQCGRYQIVFLKKFHCIFCAKTFIVLDKWF
jgi:hypothetical protein